MQRHIPVTVNMVTRRRMHPAELKRRIPFLGEAMLGHLRYGTHSGDGSALCHPYLRRSNVASRNLALAGNFSSPSASTRSATRTRA